MENVATEVIKHVACIVGVLKVFVVGARISYPLKQRIGSVDAFVLVDPGLAKHNRQASTAPLDGAGKYL
jgi:hypothetical protein